MKYAMRLLVFSLVVFGTVAATSFDAKFFEDIFECFSGETGTKAHLGSLLTNARVENDRDYVQRELAIYSPAGLQECKALLIGLKFAWESYIASEPVMRFEGSASCILAAGLMAVGVAVMPSGLYYNPEGIGRALISIGIECVGISLLYKSFLKVLVTFESHVETALNRSNILLASIETALHS